MSVAIIESRHGLSRDDLDDIAELERRTLAADGGRLKLEWGVLNTRQPDLVNDFLATVDGEVVGFLGVYAFGHEQAELAGMVDPARRRQGIATAMLEAARPVVASRGYETALLVCPRSPVSAAFAAAHGAVFDHAEHAMLLSGSPAPGPSDPAVALRDATVADAELISGLIEAGFGHPAGDIAEQIRDGREQNVIIELDGAPVGYVRLTLDGGRGGVYGFVVDPAHQGKGIGRDVLRRCCGRLADAGAREVGLEVAVDNERALGLYTSIGFEQVTTEDYFRLRSSTA